MQYRFQGPESNQSKLEWHYVLSVMMVEFLHDHGLMTGSEVRVHVSSPCARSEEFKGRYAITFWSRVTKRASS